MKSITIIIISIIFILTGALIQDLYVNLELTGFALVVVGSIIMIAGLVKAINDNVK